MLTDTFSRAFRYFIWVGHAVYVGMFLGVLTRKPQYLDTVTLVMQTLLCLVLIFKYHPFRAKYQLHDSDARLIFSAGVLLFVNVVLVSLSKVSFVQEYIQRVYGVRNQVASYVLPKKLSDSHRKDQPPLSGDK